MNWLVVNHGLLLRAMLLVKDSLSAALVPGCLGAARGRVGAMLGRLALVTGGWLTKAANHSVSMVWSCASNSLSLASIAANKIRLLHVPLSVKEAEL